MGAGFCAAPIVRRKEIMTTPIAALIELIETLRGENGCPWDREQTPASIAVYLIEEVYELLEALDRGDTQAICEELGDVLFHVLFIAQLYREQGAFDVEQAAQGNHAKMVRRHPHVFGDARVASTDEVREQWQKIKVREKTGVPQTSALDAVPRHLPALMRAYRVSKAAADKGFDWEDVEGVMQKVEEEWAEFRNAISQQGASVDTHRATAEEFGDLLFTLVNVARFTRIHPETALISAIHKFSSRFKRLEAYAAKQGHRLQVLSPDELEQMWQQIKGDIP
jgi:tetrapyrrole methylase family protein/MazG family protein